MLHARGRTVWLGAAQTRAAIHDPGPAASPPGGDGLGGARRSPEPRSMTLGRLLIGWGTASATWPTHRLPATVLVRLNADGTALVQTGASDIGPGTYTVMTQSAADALGLPVSRVHFDLGDSRMPPAPVEGGSM